MSRGPYPILLMLAMALPGAARALGLGDIRVDSALNEPLSAQIDIVGATRDELIALTARVANREVFQRYGAERPAFLSSATFKVGLDAQGRPVLNVRSTDAFTDPLISFLVDLRWGKNDVVREYSLLLDPAGFGSQRQASEIAMQSAAARASAPLAAPTAPVAMAAQSASGPMQTPNTAAVRHRAALDATSAGHTRYKVTARDTLRGIARRAGAHSESQVQRMMLAIFRANPSAFEANINRLHLGAVLTLPTTTEVAAISSADAKREVHAQMTAWRLDGRPNAPHRVAANAAPAAPVAPAAPFAAPLAKREPTAQSPRTAKEDESADASLKTRVQTLEQALDDMHKQLASENAKIQDLKQVNARATTESAELVHVPIVAVPHDRQTSDSIPASRLPTSNKAVFGPIAATLALLIAGFAYTRRRLMRSLGERNEAVVANPQRVTVDSAPGAGMASTGISGKAVVTTPAAHAPRAMDKIKAAPVSAIVAPSRRLEAVVPVDSYTPPKGSDETTVSLEIDVEALERSYLDSMPGDSLNGDSPGIDSLGLDTTTLDTVAVDTSELDTAIMKSDFNTLIIQPKKLDIPVPPVNHTNLDYNLLDLDATAQHVHMPSALHDHAVVHERRTNIVDVLKTAIERDPHRSDLRMKLLETYHSAASTNLHGFMDVVRKLSQEGEHLSAEDWRKVVLMGREIAPDDILFADESKDDETLSNCA